MKHTLIVSAGAAGLLALGVAVPAVASSGSSAGSTSSAGSLSSSQLSSIEEFLADHPALAQALAGRADAWAKFLAANPTIKAELAKLAGMPADQRRAALKTWLQANPDARKALQEYRIGTKQTKLTNRQDRLKQRLQKLQNPGLAGTERLQLGQQQHPRRFQRWLRRQRDRALRLARAS